MFPLKFSHDTRKYVIRNMFEHFEVFKFYDELVDEKLMSHLRVNHSFATAVYDNNQSRHEFKYKN